jgi:hypothetical protein
MEQQWQNSPPESVYPVHERSHGRMGHWQVSGFEQLGTFATEGAGVRRWICVERRGLRAGQAVSQPQYYISSLVTTAEQFHAIIRGHWSIENRLHGVNDVTFNEDDSPQRGRFASANWSVGRNCFITIARS